MTATNHALTGAIIGLTVANPTALPLALLSHFVLDTIPHYGSTMPEEKLYKTKGFSRYLIVEASACFLIVLLLAINQPNSWLLAAVCAFLAASPDLISFTRFQTMRADKQFKPGLYARFARKIQWFERPIGAVVEVAWFLSAVMILAIYL